MREKIEQRTNSGLILICPFLLNLCHGNRLLNQYSPVPRAQLDCWEGRDRRARSASTDLCRLSKVTVTGYMSHIPLTE